MADKKVTLSVVLISWNQLDFLRRLVRQMLDQDYDPADYEVIIVDDGSADGTQEWLQEQADPRLVILLSKDMCGRSTSRNRGVLKARGKIIVMLDGDHTVNRDFLSIHAARHREKLCAIVGKSDFADHPDFVALNHYLNNGGAVKLPHDAPLPGRYFLTRNCSVPKEILLKIGLFDDRYHVWGGEDLDIGAKIEDAGIPIYGESNALAVHHHLRPLHDLLDNLYEYGRLGVPHILDRHPRMFQELNLDRLLPNPFEGDRFSNLQRLLHRLFMLLPFYVCIKFIANLFRRHKLPRWIFDYLHLRQYGFGYIASLKSNKTSADRDGNTY